MTPLIYTLYQGLGIGKDRFAKGLQRVEKKAHYANACTDVTFSFPFGVSELMGIAARGDYDLKAHTEGSGKSMEYFDEGQKQKYIPHVIEPSAGVDRIALALASASSPATVSDRQMRAHALRLHQWKQALAFQRPVMPVRGKDLGDAGIPAGPAMGRLLATLEDAWVSSGFALTRDDLLALAREKTGASEPRD